MAEYRPGVCNIGKNETRKRYALAVIGFVLAAILSYFIAASLLSQWALIIVFILLALAFEGFYQGYFHFCAGFAAAGIYDFTGTSSSKGKVTDAGSHKKDLGMARRIHLYSLASAIILAVILYFVL